jgi:flavin-dependent dehydrogenase
MKSTSDTFDAVVIGAGPAGALAARQLANAGKRTLLVERQAWPRIKVCGGCLNSRAILVLRTHGLLSVLDQCSAVPLMQLQIHMRAHTNIVKLPGGGVAIDRSAFDAALVDVATQAGVEFRPATRATVLPITSENEARHVSLSSSTNEKQIVSARIVVAADGLGHPSVAALPEFAESITEGSRIGLAIVVEEMPQELCSGTIYMAVGQAGYVGLVRTADGHGNLAAAIDGHALKHFNEPSECIASILKEAGLPFSNFTQDNSWRGTITLARRSKTIIAHRLILIGDAAGYVEPFTGEGIGWAMNSAIETAPVLLNNIDRWDAAELVAWEKMQKRQTSREQLACRMLAGLLRRPLAVRLALRALATMPALARPLVKRVY